LDLPTLNFDPLDPSFIADPYPVYAALRQQDPVHRSPQGFWVLTRFKDITDVMALGHLSNQPSKYSVLKPSNSEKYVAASVANNIIPFMDPPVHTDARKLISRTFNAQLRHNAPDMKGIARQLLEGFRDKGRIDIANEFGTPYSALIVADMLGIPASEAGKLTKWSYWFFYLFAPIPSQMILDQVNEALAEFREYFSKVVAEKETAPGDDLISRMLGENVEGILSRSELIDTCLLLVADAVENVDSGIASCLMHLLQIPGLTEKLRRQPDLLQSAVDEALRFDSPAQFVAKSVAEDFSYAGKSIRKNDALLLVFASANRDHDFIDDPDEFRLDREGGVKHLSFGKGRHSCIGAPLVRAEMSDALEVILEMLGNMRVDEPELEWQSRLGHRWLSRLHITFDPF